MEGFMLNNDRHTYRMRLDAKQGCLVSKIKNPNGEWVEDKRMKGVKGILTDASVKYNENAEKHYLYLTFSHEGETLMVYAPFNNAVLDLINRLSGPVDAFGRECTLKVWPVKLANGTTAGIALYAEDERCEWKYDVAAIGRVRQASRDKWAEMFTKFVAPKVEAYKAINLDPLVSNHPQPTPAQANGYNDPAEQQDDSVPDDLPF